MNIAVFGARGRVGSRAAEIAKKRGHNVYEIDKDYEENRLEKIDVTIDFATAEATKETCDFCMQHRCPLVSGVTGRKEEEITLIENLKKHVFVVEKSNFSQGVAILERICDIVSRELKEWDCEIIETHRKGKKDAPSGTAKGLASIISANKGSFSSVYVHSVRAGSNFGKHEIVFATNGESITLVHQAENSDIFALGAVKTAENLVDGLA